MPSNFSRHSRLLLATSAFFSAVRPFSFYFLTVPRVRPSCLSFQIVYTTHSQPQITKRTIIQNRTAFRWNVGVLTLKLHRERTSNSSTHSMSTLRHNAETYTSLLLRQFFSHCSRQERVDNANMARHSSRSFLT